jgi:hypothetical protein
MPVSHGAHTDASDATTKFDARTRSRGASAAHLEMLASRRSVVELKRSILLLKEQCGGCWDVRLAGRHRSPTVTLDDVRARHTRLMDAVRQSVPEWMPVAVEQRPPMLPWDECDATQHISRCGKLDPVGSVHDGKRPSVSLNVEFTDQGHEERSSLTAQVGAFAVSLGASLGALFGSDSDSAFADEAMSLSDSQSGEEVNASLPSGVAMVGVSQRGEGMCSQSPPVYTHWPADAHAALPALRTGSCLDTNSFLKTAQPPSVHHTPKSSQRWARPSPEPTARAGSPALGLPAQLVPSVAGQRDSRPGAHICNSSASEQASGGHSRMVTAFGCNATFRPNLKPLPRPS